MIPHPPMFLLILTCLALCLLPLRGSNTPRF